MKGQAATGRELLHVALVAAYPTVRAGLRALLSSDPTFEIVAESATVHDLPLGGGLEIDVTVVDLEPDGFGDVTGDLLALPPEVGLVILGPDTWEGSLVNALGERAWAYLLKEASGPELLRAVEAVGAGLVVIQPPLTRRLLAAVRVEVLDDGPGESLTAREHEVLQLVAQGLPNKVIALRLRISEHTVKFHVTSILSKLGASSRTEAVRLGARRGLIVL